MASVNPADAFKGYTWETHSIPFSVYKIGVDDGRYDLDPPHQREVVHNTKWKQEIIKSACQYNDIPPVRFHTKVNTDGIQVYESLDGKQRSEAIVGFMKGDYSVMFKEWDYDKEKYYSELTPAQRHFIDNRILEVKVTHSTLDTDEISQFFQRAQQTKITQLGEHLNSDIGSKKREIALYVLDDPSIKDIMSNIKPKNSRFSYLEIIARLLYCYDTDNHSGCFDPSPDKIKKWWNEKDGSNINRSDFKTDITSLLTIINDSELTYKSSKVTYLPVFWYLMNYPNKTDDLKRYISTSTIWKYIQNGGQGTSAERYKQLEEEIH